MNGLSHQERASFFISFRHQMSESLQAYKSYIDNGKTFLYAKELRRINSATILLLENNKDTLGDELKKAANQLLEHYHIWRDKWDEEANAANPADEDVFAFANAHTFPKAAALLLEEECKK